jgi:heptosyltransferase-2
MNPTKILLRCPNPVGDFIMATPALRAIRSHFPQAHISLLLRPPLQELAEGAPWFDNIILCPKQGDTSLFLPYLNLIYQLRKESFDLGILFPNSFGSAWVLWLGGVRRVVGYARDGRSFLLTDRIKVPKENGSFIPQPMISYYQGILNYLGIPSTIANLELYVTKQYQEKALTILEEHGISPQRLLVEINPSAGFGPSKYWRTDYFAQVADALIEQYDSQIVLLPSPGEYLLAREIKEKMRHEPIILKGEEVSLGLFKALIQQCHLFITTDSGPRHIAVALDKPVVVIMGPTHPAYSDVKHSKTIVLRENLDCSPCHLKVCPTAHECMELITPEKVLGAIATLIETNRIKI